MMLIAATGLTVAPAFVLALISLLTVPVVLRLGETADRPAGGGSEEHFAGASPEKSGPTAEQGR